MENTIAVGYWTKLADGRLQCEACPRHCRLRDEQRGFCFVRGRQGDTMVLHSYGRSSGFCLDPIEKKPLNHFLPGSSVLSFGTAGCNLGCRFCQNWDMSKSREMDTLGQAAGPEAIAGAAARYGARSVAFTYNDPTIFLEYAIATAKACHQRDIRTVAVTAGYIGPEARRDLYRHIDAANVDLKGFDPEFYKYLCLADLEPVLETLQYLVHEAGVWVEITNLVIPTKNDSDDELRALSQWVRRELGPDVPLHFTAFHPDFKLRDLPRTPPRTLTHAREIAIQAGLHHVYTGNVHDRDGQSTWCSHCGRRLIGRDWYELSDWHLDAEGRCDGCGTLLPGLFEAEPGTWGARRQPVSPSG